MARGKGEKKKKAAPRTAPSTTSKRNKPQRRDKGVVARAMRRVKSASTTPELTLRKALFQRGFRYRLHRKELPGKPDIVFVSARVALFVDGDFWHGNQWRLRKKKNLDDQLAGIHNETYWKAKIERNRDRDRRVNQLLKKAGWQVIRVWESDINRRLDYCVEKIIRLLDGGKKGGGV